MEILTFGAGGRLAECERVLSSRLSELCGRLFLLPIPTSRDKKYITDTTLTIDELCSALRSGDRIVGYEIPPAILLRAEALGIQVYDAAGDERLLCANAALTARGTLGYLISHTDRDITELSLGIVGYGRIGRRLANLLLILGADLTVYTGRESVARELGEVGVSAEIVGEGCDTGGLDILINTSPTRQIEERDLPQNTRIIDLASGRVYPPSDRVTRLPSVPEKMFPVTAGRLYAEGVLRAMFGDLL
jgi:hypothetical protein